MPCNCEMEVLDSCEHQNGCNGSRSSESHHPHRKFHDNNEFEEPKQKDVEHTHAVDVESVRSIYFISTHVMYLENHK